MSVAFDSSDQDRIRAVTRDCGALAVECSDLAGYVETVGNRIGAHLETLGALERVVAALITDQHAVAQSTSDARAIAATARERLEAGSVTVGETIAVFEALTDLIVHLGERMTGFASAMEQVRGATAGTR